MNLEEKKAKLKAKQDFCNSLSDEIYELEREIIREEVLEVLAKGALSDGTWTLENGLYLRADDRDFPIWSTLFKNYHCGFDLTDYVHIFESRVYCRSDDGDLGISANKISDLKLLVCTYNMKVKADRLYADYLNAEERTRELKALIDQWK
jgi:hypothetical protein